MFDCLFLKKKKKQALHQEQFLYIYKKLKEIHVGPLSCYSTLQEQ